ncbi:unnamed protein product [Ostreobium quekettii]|uniref:Uncharacterized protein n=1 Tax=Ostreobium quekettii TaxID=121088 RepID=A0A8S1J4I7_9CHLO|nr:unnamed protein product [Ostreobium quekettii]|eukprot:evm.model.scf_787.1 EVM.evm.TU.scf_787.1   scf_787:5941-9116(+)
MDMMTDRLVSGAARRPLPVRSAPDKPAAGNRRASICARAQQLESADSSQTHTSRRPILVGVLGVCSSLIAARGAQAFTKAEAKRQAAIQNSESLLESLLEQQEVAGVAQATEEAPEEKSATEQVQVAQAPAETAVAAQKTPEASRGTVEEDEYTKAVDDFVARISSM